jgi:hypothetical protein
LWIHHHLIDWYQTEERIDAKLPLLSMYLGHVDPASSYWYLEASPELMTLVRDNRGAAASVAEDVLVDVNRKVLVGDAAVGAVHPCLQV